MNDFKNEISTQKLPDPYKRVKYTMGLVMGVDEFEQEQLYLIEKNRLHNRALHGYGTVCGLQVSVRTTDGVPEVVVSPGIAVNPMGQEIRVPSAQCAQLNQWLTSHKNEISERFGFSPPETVSIYVVLCYRDCETDKVPVPGVPCRSQEDTMVASRIADDFELSLRLPSSALSESEKDKEKIVPSQLEEEVVRRFGELLSRIEINSGPGNLTLEDMENLVRELIEEPGSIPAVPIGNESFPAAGENLRLHPDTACNVLHAAFRVWVTEVRPKILGKDNNCALCSKDELCSCVRLARLEFPVEEVDGRIQVMGDAFSVAVIEDDRPVLLHTRLLQEWLMCGRFDKGSPKSNRTFVTMFVLNPTTIRAWVHYPLLLDIPTSAVMIEVDDTLIESFPQPLPELVSVQPVQDINVFDLELSSPLTNHNRVTVRFNTSLITEMGSLPRTLMDALKEIDYAYLDQDSDTLLAYLSVDLPETDNSIIPGPREQPVNLLSAVNLPTRSGGEWIQQLVKSLPFVTITHISRLVGAGTYELWFNIDAPGNKVEIQSLKYALDIFMETKKAPDYLEKIEYKIKWTGINVFQVSLKKESDWLRFIFDISKITLKEGQTVREYAIRNRISFMGHDGQDTVTAFVRKG